VAAVVALLALAVPAVSSAQQFPGVFTVTTTKDGNDGECNSDCTLREAVSLATTSGTSINLPSGVYKLTLGAPLRVQNAVIIGAGLSGGQGAGARTTIIDANGAGRVIQAPAGTSSILAGLTITGGRAASGAGAFVEANAQLSFYNVSVDGNVATTRGGGVQVAGSLATIGTTISGNRVSGGNGGGIAVESGGSATLEASTISNNTAAAGAAITSGAGSLILWHMTVAGGFNVEPGGSAGSFTLWNSLVAGGGAGACQGTLGPAPHNQWTGNLADDATCNFAAGEGTVGADPRLGGLTNNRGPTDTRALLSSSPAINTADQNRCFGTDQRGAAPVAACDIGAFEFGGHVPEPTLPPPVPGETANASVKSGTVKVKIPGADEFFVLKQGQQVPVGTTFDTSHGKVTLITAANQQGKTQKGWFYSGVFKVGQSKGKKPLTTLSMTGKLSCGGGGKASAAAAKKKKRRLWGDGKGRFRTKGKHSAATVVGTKWLVEDRCNGTLTKVKRGVVSVRDFKRRKTIRVTAGHQYFAKR
jgi:CSLREA domain-containing protein